MQFLQLIKDMHAILKRLEEMVMSIRKEGNEFDVVLKYGLEGFRDRILKLAKEKQEFNPSVWIIGVIQKEPSLRFPHRKILEFLARQYDYEKSQFKEINFSRIVKECRVGRKEAHSYFTLLAEKDLVKRRTDGYRVYYSIKQATTER